MRSRPRAVGLPIPPRAAASALAGPPRAVTTAGRVAASPDDRVPGQDSATRTVTITTTGRVARIPVLANIVAPYARPGGSIAACAASSSSTIATVWLTVRVAAVLGSSSAAW